MKSLAIGTVFLAAPGSAVPQVTVPVESDEEEQTILDGLDDPPELPEEFGDLLTAGPPEDRYEFHTADWAEAIHELPTAYSPEEIGDEDLKATSEVDYWTALHSVTDALTRAGREGDFETLRMASEVANTLGDEQVDPDTMVTHIGSVSDPLQAVKQLHGVFVKKQAAPEQLVTSADPADVIRWCDAVQQILPDSTAVDELRGHPGSATRSTVAEPGGGPDWLLIAVKTSLSADDHEGIGALIGYVLKRRRGAPDTEKLLNVARGSVETLFGPVREVLQETHPAKATLRWDLVLESGDRFRCLMDERGRALDISASSLRVP